MPNHNCCYNGQDSIGLFSFLLNSDLDFNILRLVVSCKSICLLIKHGKKHETGLIEKIKEKKDMFILRKENYDLKKIR